LNRETDHLPDLGPRDVHAEQISCRLKGLLFSRLVQEVLN